jgi:hypothetical protein
MGSFHRATPGSAMAIYRPKALQLIFAASPGQQVTDPLGLMNLGCQLCTTFALPIYGHYAASVMDAA